MPESVCLIEMIVDDEEQVYINNQDFLICWTQQRGFVKNSYR
jgi:hypothetical protein